MFHSKKNAFALTSGVSMLAGDQNGLGTLIIPLVPITTALLVSSAQIEQLSWATLFPGYLVVSVCGVGWMGRGE